MPSTIPIQNIYYLLVYAWDYLDESGLVDVESLDSTELVDLYAAVLWSGIRHLSRRGLHQDYVSFEEDIAGIRGRVDVAATARRMLAQHGRAHCMFDELHVNTLPNRILLATTHRLIESSQLDLDLRRQGIEIVRGMRQVSTTEISSRTFRSVQLYGASRTYRFLLDLCRLIIESSFVNESTGDVRFRDFVRDPKALARLYEKFLFNFFRRECPHAEVSSDRITWEATSVDDPDLSYLPQMQTDISIRTPGHTLIIDAKFYEHTFQSNYGKDTVHSGNLYQLYSYLQNLKQRDGNSKSLRGLLLYPTVRAHHRKSYNLLGHFVGIATVDLTRSWRDIKSELLDLVS
jgi:5-methylcytosine-specific restriction enzyme subunit McrC